MPIETPSSSPSPDSHDLPLITLRSPAQLPDVPSSNSTAILQSAYKKNKLNVSRASFFKKRSKNREPRFKAEPTDIPLNSLSTEEQDTGSVWKAQWEQIKGVLIQGWGYVIKQWRKTRISKGIIDYWTMHIIYLYCLALCGAVIIFIGENSKELGSTEFINCFFLAMSAITGTGLTILPFHTSTRLSTIVCYVLMTIGSNIMLSIPPVLLRRYLYRQAHPMEFSTPNFTPDDPTSNLTRLENENTFEFTGRKMYQAMSETVSKFTPYMNEFKRLGSLSSLTNDEMNATISSKTEYHAAGLLLRLYIFYIIGFQMIGFLAIGSYAQFHSPTRLLLQNSNLNPWSWSLFHVSSCFYNSGFSLIPNSLQDLYDENVIIVTSTILAIFGNCLFPITLRWIIILMSKSKLFSKKTKKCTSFLIQHPRRASIHLFEDRETWILLL
ncbi:Sodium transporter hkt1, partial [Coelomomyces lativittatus]